MKNTVFNFSVCCITLIFATSLPSIALGQGLTEDGLSSDRNSLSHTESAFAAPGTTPYIEEEPPLFALGATVGGNYSILSAPNDQPNDITLLSGASFEGLSYYANLEARYYFYTHHFVSFFTQIAVGIANQEGTGRIQKESDPKVFRSLTLQSLRLRLPLVLGMRLGLSEHVGVNIYAGAEGIIGLKTSMKVKQNQVPTNPTTYKSKGVLHVGAVAGLELDFRWNQTFSFPITASYVFDPMVKRKTRERFEGFQTIQEPGTFQLGFDHTIFFGAGFRLLF